MEFLKPAAFCIAPFVGTIPGTYYTRINIAERWYKNLKQPSWRPYRPLIIPTWTVMYTSMGYASYMVYRDCGGFKGPARAALALYGTQLVLNWAWPPIFMGAKQMGLAYVDMLALIGCICGTIYKFRAINRTAGNLLIPYLIWIGYASCLNLYVWRNNPDFKKDL